MWSISILTLFSENNSESYWLDKVEQILTECIKICRLYNNGYVTFLELHKLVTNEDYFNEKIKIIKELFISSKLNKNEIYELNASLDFFQKEFENLEVQILDVLEKYEMIYPEEIINCMKAENVEKVKVISYSLALAIKENVGYLLYKMNREQIISLYDESKIRENEYKGTDKEIQSFTNNYYKSLKGQLLKGRDPSFFVSKNEENQSKLLEELNV